MISLLTLLPKNLNLSFENKELVQEGILLGVINDINQTQLLNAIYNYRNNLYLKSMWEVQRMGQEYNLLHLISISLADQVPLKNIHDSIDAFNENLINEAYIKSTANIDWVIFNSHSKEYE